MGVAKILVKRNKRDSNIDVINIGWSNFGEFACWLHKTLGEVCFGVQTEEKVEGQTVDVEFIQSPYLTLSFIKVVEASSYDVCCLGRVKQLFCFKRTSRFSFTAVMTFAC